jgi:hypothetical protein
MSPLAPKRNVYEFAQRMSYLSCSSSIIKVKAPFSNGRGQTLGYPERRDLGETLLQTAWTQENGRKNERTVDYDTRDLGVRSGKAATTLAALL